MESTLDREGLESKKLLERKEEKEILFERNTTPPFYSNNLACQEGFTKRENNLLI
jgi:hypothetical protein